MERKFNYADLNQVSKKTVAKNRRIEEQAEEFIKQHQTKLKAEEASREAKLNEEVLNNARFSQGSIYAKNKARVKAMQEAVSYTDKASLAVMTDVLSTIVENSLLLDVKDYAKLNPNYKQTIKETVSSFLKNGGIESFIENKNTLAIMEHVARSIPDVKTGVYLKEEELIDIVKRSTPAEINSAIDSLSGDVKQRVANIVVKEQGEADEIEKEVEEVIKSTKKPEELEAEEMAAAQAEMPAEEVPAEGMEEMPMEEPVEGEFTGEEVPAEGMEEMPMEQPTQEDPYADDEYLEYQQEGQPVVNKTSIMVDPSGAVKIDVLHEEFKKFLIEDITEDDKKFLIGLKNLTESEFLNEGLLNWARWKLAKFSLRFLSTTSLIDFLEGYYSDKEGNPTEKSKQVAKMSRKELIKKVRQLAENLDTKEKDKIMNSSPAKKLEKEALGNVAIAAAVGIGGAASKNLAGKTEFFSVRSKLIGQDLNSLQIDKGIDQSPWSQSNMGWIGGITRLLTTLSSLFFGVMWGALILSGVAAGQGLRKVAKASVVRREEILSTLSSKKDLKENFYRETPRQGILESLALNEAKEMVAEGKEYNGDLALGNALLQLTILETFNVSGLMPISEMEYKKMLNVPVKKKKIVKEELGDAAAEPVHTDVAAKEHTPEVKSEDVIDSVQPAQDVKEVVVESWKQKALKALNK